MNKVGRKLLLLGCPFVGGLSAYAEGTDVATTLTSDMATLGTTAQSFGTAQGAIVTALASIIIVGLVFYFLKFGARNSK